MTALLEPLLQSPLLPQFIEELTQVHLRVQFYRDVDEDRKWEFINGEIFIHSPAKLRHAEVTGWVSALLQAHVREHRLVKVFVEKCLNCFPRNDYEPEIVFFGNVKAQALAPDQMKFSIPDLIVEVLSPSSGKHDRRVKFEDYAVHGVGEFWVIDPEKETLELYRNRGNAYPPVEPQKEGRVQSDVIAGFEVPIRAFFDAEIQHQTLRQILA